MTHHHFKLKLLVATISLSLSPLYANAEDTLDAAMKAAHERAEAQSTSWFDALSQGVLDRNPALNDGTAELDRQGSNDLVITDESNERWKLAKADESQKHNYRFGIFTNAALGSRDELGQIAYSKSGDTNYSQLYEIIHDAQYTNDPNKKRSRRADSILKDTYARGRPYQVIDNNGQYESNYKSITGSSFPSGHTWEGFREAAVWSTIFPERGDEIYSRALQYGESRTVLGRHFPTDTIASRAGNYFYLANILDDDATTETFVAMAKKIRAEANVDCVAGQSLQSCLLEKPTPLTSEYAKQNDSIGYYGLITDPADDSQVNVSDLNPIAANLLRIRYPYLSNEQRLETLAGTAYPKNSIAAKAANGNWGLINLPKAYTGPTRLDSNWTVDQDYNEQRDVSGFGQYDEWRNDITGSGKLIKQGAGTLALTGTNSFAGFDLNAGTLELRATNNLSKPSTVTNGVLNIASGGNLQSNLAISGGEVNILDNGSIKNSTVTATTNGVLNIASGGELQSDLAISGGEVNILDNGSINNNEVSMTGGELNITAGGAFNSNNASFTDANVNITSDNLINSKNFSFTNANLNLLPISFSANAINTAGVSSATAAPRRLTRALANLPSTVTLAGNVVAKDSQINLANGVAGDKLTITGNYTTGGNTWLMDSYLTGQGQSTNLGTDGKSYTDNVKITGDLIDNGVDKVQVNNLNIADPTGKESILMYDIDGASNGTFALQGRVAKGGYDYLLNKHTDGDWYLESNSGSTTNTGSTANNTPVIRPEVGSYLANANAGNNLFIHRLEDRQSASTDTNQGHNDLGQLWIRAVGGTHESDDKSGQINTDGHNYIVHGGMGVANFGANDEFNVGVMAAYGHAENDSQSAVTNHKSSSTVNGYGVGLYGTWQQNPIEKTGLYANTWAMWNQFDNKVSGQDFGSVEYDSSGMLASIEAGSTYQLSQSEQGVSYWIQPQGQITYQNIQQDAFTEATTGTQVNKGKANIQTRVGAKAYMDVPTDISQTSSYRPFVAVNWLHNTSADEQVNLDNTYYGTGGNSNIGEVKVGLEGQPSQNSHASVNISYQQGSDYNNVTGSIGWTVDF